MDDIKITPQDSNADSNQPNPQPAAEPVMQEPVESSFNLKGALSADSAPNAAESQSQASSIEIKQEEAGGNPADSVPATQPADSESNQPANIKASLAKTPEEIDEEIKKQKRSQKIWMVGAAVLIVIIILAGYFLKNGTQLQGSARLNDVKKATSSLQFCPVNEYFPFEENSANKEFNAKKCKQIPKEDVELINALKENPIEYYINPDTFKEDWWQETAGSSDTAIKVIEEYIDQASLENLETQENVKNVQSEFFESDTKEIKSMEITTDEENKEVNATYSETQQNKATYEITPQETYGITSTTTYASFEETINCENEIAQASTFADRGDVNEAYQRQLKQLTAEQCHPDYGICQQRLAGAVAAKLYMNFAKSIGHDTSMLMSEYDKHETAFFSDNNCIDVNSLCSALTANGFSSSSDTVPLAALSSSNTDGTNEGTSAFSQPILEENISRAITDNNLYTEKIFFEKYCAVSPATTIDTTMETIRLTSPPKIRRTTR
jgi:hypothetical protein